MSEYLISLICNQLTDVICYEVISSPKCKIRVVFFFFSACFHFSPSYSPVCPLSSKHRRPRSTECQAPSTPRNGTILDSWRPLKAWVWFGWVACVWRNLNENMHTWSMHGGLEFSITSRRWRIIMCLVQIQQTWRHLCNCIRGYPEGRHTREMLLQK